MESDSLEEQREAPTGASAPPPVYNNNIFGKHEKMCVFFDEIFNVDKKTFPIFETHEIYDTKMVKMTKK